MHRLGMGAEALRTAKRMKHPGHILVLGALAEYYTNEFSYLSFKNISEICGINPTSVRLIVRHLKRKGLAEYSTLISEDTQAPCGSGHSATRLGYTVYKIIEGWGNVGTKKESPKTSGELPSPN